MDNSQPDIFIVMGVSACGKTTLGEALAAEFGCPFFDGDDFHPPENIVKMKAEEPLGDSDREGWLKALNALARKHTGSGGAVIACSALKEKYRDWLREGLDPGEICWVVLTGTFEDILERIQARADHYMPPALLRSQFADLEVPDYGIHLPAYGMPTDEMVRRVAAHIQSER